MKNFRTYQLAKHFYKSSQGLRFKAHFRDQFNRALLSIVLNLAEGSGKPTSKDRAKFYSIAMGSLREVQAILDLNEYNAHLKASDSLAASLFRELPGTWVTQYTGSRCSRPG
jgi:four helix bundle protein